MLKIEAVGRDMNIFTTERHSLVSAVSAANNFFFQGSTDIRIRSFNSTTVDHGTFPLDLLHSNTNFTPDVLHPRIFETPDILIQFLLPMEEIYLPILQPVEI